MIIKEMIKEEWRMHSEIFSGRSFAFFPMIILALSSFASWSIIDFSTLGPEALSRGLIFLGAFFGLSVGSIGFSSRDAMKNVLGPTNFLVYSSRTLPVSERRLLAAFLLKDLIYYAALFLTPMALGAAMFAGLQVISGIFWMFGAFLLGLSFAILVARASIKLPGFSRRYNGFVSPLTDKTLLDISRSAGGLIKILFSLTILTGFYWFTVLYFPFASAFLNNPVISFSVLISVISLSVYNWINRFDSVEDYLYLPVDENQLLKAKQKAFLMISVPLTIFFVLISLIYYPSTALVAFVALLTSVSVQIYTVGLASSLTGLNPNSKLFDSRIFTKYLLLNSVVILPLLTLSVVLSSELLPFFTLISILPGLFGSYLLYR